MLDLLRTNIFGLAILSLFPILLWFAFFHEKYPQRMRHVVLSFLAGMASVIPIKLYEKYWDVSVLYFEHINLFQSIAELARIPSLSRLFAFIALSALVALLLFIFTALLMMVLEVASGDNTLKAYEHKVRKILETPFLFVSIGVLTGVLAFFLSMSLHEKIWFFVIVGMLEEYIKHLVLRFSNEESIKRIRDAISFSIIVALGFAYVENIIYFHDFGTSAAAGGNFWVLFVLRSLISVTAHVCFSGILAYFYGVAFFSKEIYQYDLAHNKDKLIYTLHRMLHLKGSVLFHEQKMMEGMLVAMFLHALFNIFLEFELISLMLGLLMGMFIGILYIYRRARFVTETKVCPFNSSACMPRDRFAEQI